MKIYDWGFFFEDGNHFSIPVPFGPESPGNMIYELDDEWFVRLNEVYPGMMEEIIEQKEWPFAVVVVNPLRDATAEEELHFKNNGWV